MCVGDEQLVNPVVLFGRRGLFAAPAALLRAVFGQRLALDIAGVAERDHHVGGCDQVFGGQVLRAVFDQAAARAEFAVAKLRLDGVQLATNDGGDALWRGEDGQQVFDDRHHLFVFRNDLVLLQAGEALQAHLQNLLRLGVGQAVEAVLAHAELALQPFGAVIVGLDGAAIGAGAGQHLAHQRTVPAAGHQRAFGDRWGWGIADDGDEFVNVRQRHCQAFEDVAAVARLAQLKHGAARDYFAAVLQKDADQRL